jgi:hypothetical protein
LTRLLYHLDKHFSGQGRIPYFPQEGDTHSFDAILSFEADVEAEAIDRSHGRLLCLNASKPFHEQDECILVVGVHVSDDLAFRFNQRIGLYLADRQVQSRARPLNLPVFELA